MWPTESSDPSTHVCTAPGKLFADLGLAVGFNISGPKDKSGKEDVPCQLHFAVNIWKAKLQLFSTPHYHPRLLFFFCTLKVFVLMPSVLRFSALLKKHFHDSDEIELLGLGFKNIYICICLCLAV